MTDERLPEGQLSPFDYDDDPAKVAQMDREEQTEMPPLPPWEPEPAAEDD